MKTMRKRLLSIFLVLVMVLCLAPVTAFATDTWTEVSTEEALLSALENGGNIRLKNDIRIFDCTLNQTTISNAVNLDLNGKEMDCENDLYIANGGALTVSDSSDNGSGSLLLMAMKIQTGGSLTLNSGNVVCRVTIINTGTVTMNGGLLKGAFGNFASGLFYMNGGEIDSGSAQAIVNKGGTIYAGGGTVSSTTEDGVICNNGGSISGAGTEETVFNSKVQIYFGGTVADGIFNQKVTVYADTGYGAGQITGGTYNGEVDNRGIISDGTFNGPVTNNGTITGGIFYGGITGNGTIDGLTVTHKIGSEDYAVQVVQNGDNAAKPIDPSKTGYILSGWYTDPECSNVFDFESTPVTNDITLYAYFREATHTVTFSTDHGSIDPEAVTVDDNKTVTKPDDPTASGYTFGGWYTDEAFTTEYVFTTPVTADITLYAKWTDIVDPVISGIEDGKTYCEAQTVTVTDENLNTVTVNGEAVTLDENNQFVLSPAKGEQKIVVTDKDGNEATITVTVNDDHTPGGWITDKSATASETGSRHKECTVCGKVLEEEAIAKLVPAEKTNAAQTGDGSSMFLWLALLLVSGGAVKAAAIAGKKRKYNR